MGKMWSIVLYQDENNALMNGKWLKDLHTEAAQQLLKKQFSKYGGFQSTLTQLTPPLRQLDNYIQIVHVDHRANIQKP